jgi:hypothetical protein
MWHVLARHLGLSRGMVMIVMIRIDIESCRNQDIGLDIAADLYKTAKMLDPSRPVNTADGVWTTPAACCPQPLDFESHGFSLNTIPIVQPGWGKLAGTPKLPVINHEMGNFVSWPMLTDQISRCSVRCVLLGGRLD